MGEGRRYRRRRWSRRRAHDGFAYSRTRGHLPKGSTIEMVLDRQISFNGEEIDFRSSPNPANFSDGSGPAPAQKTGGAGGLRRLPI